MSALTPYVPVSVIMTVYNGEAFLREALDSIFSQTFTDFEVVVVNNCSTDGTGDILESIDDPRLRVVNAPRHGSFCYGIRLAYQFARGRYIAVNDADDVSLPQRLEHQKEFLDRNTSAGLVSAQYQEIDLGGTPGLTRRPPSEWQALREFYPGQNPLAHSTYMYRRVASDSVAGYPPQYQYGADFGMAIRMAKRGWRICVLPEVLVKIRIHEGQTSIDPSHSIARAHDALYLFQEARNLPCVLPLSRKRGKDAVAKYRLVLGWAQICRGYWISGLRHVTIGVLGHPMLAVAYVSYFVRRKLLPDRNHRPPVVINEFLTTDESAY